MQENEEGMAGRPQGDTPVGTQAQQPVTPPGQSQATQAVQAQLTGLLNVVRCGGGWFYWIAVLSIINSIVTKAQMGIHFLAGLGATQVVDAIVHESGAIAALLGIPFIVAIAGVYFMFGYFACRRAKWAFITGMVFYLLDALLLLAFSDWFGLAFHAWAMYGIFNGFKANNVAQKLEAEMRRQAYYAGSAS